MISPRLGGTFDTDTVISRVVIGISAHDAISQPHVHKSRAISHTVIAISPSLAPLAPDTLSLAKSFRIFAIVRHKKVRYNLTTPPTVTVGEIKNAKTPRSFGSS